MERERQGGMGVLESAKVAMTGLEMMFGRIRARLDDPEVDLAFRPDETWNIYGAIVKHICHTTRAYVVNRMAGGEVPVPPAAEQWSGEGIGRDELHRLVDETEAMVRTSLEGMTAGAWEEEVELYNRRLRRGDLPLWALVHGSQHVGQLLLMDRVRRNRSTA